MIFIRRLKDISSPKSISCLHKVSVSHAYFEPGMKDNPNRLISGSSDTCWPVAMSTNLPECLNGLKVP